MWYSYCVCMIKSNITHKVGWECYDTASTDLQMVSIIHFSMAQCPSLFHLVTAYSHTSHTASAAYVVGVSDFELKVGLMVTRVSG